MEAWSLIEILHDIFWDGMDLNPLHMPLIKKLKFTASLQSVEVNSRKFVSVLILCKINFPLRKKLSELDKNSQLLKKSSRGTIEHNKQISIFQFQIIYLVLSSLNK